MTYTKVSLLFPRIELTLHLLYNTDVFKLREIARLRTVANVTSFQLIEFGNPNSLLLCIYISRDKSDNMQI